MTDSSPQEVNSAEAEAVVKTVEAEAKTDGKTPPAESSPAEPKGDGKGSILDRVKDALKKPDTEKAPDSDEQGSKLEAKPEAEAEGDDAGDLTEEQLSQEKPKTAARMRNLLKDRADLTQKVGELEPKATALDQITRFVEDANLSKDEVNRGFDVMKALKNDQFQAYQLLRPIMDQLEQIVGVRLPDDLQQAVNLGQLTEAHAKELASNRGKTQVTTQQLQRRDQQDERRKATEAFQGRVDTVSGAVSEWEKSKAKTDPDWQLKQPRVSELIELEIVRRQRTDKDYFPTKDEALKFSADALEKVEKEFKSFAPRRREIKAGHVEGAVTLSMPKPKTLLEAAKQGLARARATG